MPFPPVSTTVAPATPAVTQAPTTTVAEAEEDPIYLAIIWHQHQPVYFKDPDTGIYAKPWVRVHATKDYVDMAAILKQYPSIRATFNITPSLIRQIDDLEAGQKTCIG
jgi:alpha-amylase/alpha-mannosidase (GH57 family)